jgi:predicted deacylase
MTPRLTAIGLLFGATTLGVGATSAQELSRYRLRGRDAASAAARFTARGFDVVEGSVHGDRLDIIATDPEHRRLKRQLGELQIDLVEPGGPLSRPRARRLPEGVFASFEGPEGYEDYDAIVARMRAISTANPDISRFVDLTTELGAPPTAEGRHIFGVKISDNVERREDEPSFLMVSAHHAREINTPVVSMDALARLVGGYGGDPAISLAVNEYEIWIVPVWNPDGYQYVFSTERFWRKNRRALEESGGVGVDLNRNYPFDWDGQCPGSVTPEDETYRGPAASSEAETQTMLRLAARQRFAKVIDYHSFGRLVHWSYLCRTHPFDAFFESEAAAIARAAQYDEALRPPAHGMNHQFHQVSMGSYSFLMETNTEFQPTFDTAVTEAQRVWPSTLLMLRRPITISGHVRDRGSRAPIAATIAFKGISFPNGERFGSGGEFGRFDLIVPPGSYELEVAAPGYRTSIVPVDVTSDSTRAVEIDLSRDSYPMDAAIAAPFDGGMTSPLDGSSDTLAADRPGDSSALLDAPSSPAPQVTAGLLTDALPVRMPDASADAAERSPRADDEGGCACAVGTSAASPRSGKLIALLAFALGVAFLRGRRARPARRRADV